MLSMNPTITDRDIACPIIRRFSTSGILSCLLLLNPVFAVTPVETFTRVEELSFSPQEAVHWQTPIETYGGNIYFTYVDSQGNTKIVKKIPGGATTSTVIEPNTITTDGNHPLPSLGIDRNGFIHVAYNMHQHPWQYKVSNASENIGSFTFIGGVEANTRGLPGLTFTDWVKGKAGISYPSFVKDNNGELYVTFRHGVRADGQLGGQGVGTQGLGIAKYNADTGTWHMLGGNSATNPAYPHAAKTFFWSNSSRVDPGKPGGYQGYRARIFFDTNNRMHISWDVFIQPGAEASHIMYAYSDDGGLTFKKANGNTISALPITPQNGDIVKQAPNGIYDTRTYVGRNANGRPMVSFRDRINSPNKSYYSTWTGTAWSTSTIFNAGLPPNFITDQNGVITAINNGQFHRSFDNGTTWQSYSIPNSVESTAIDYAYMRSTGHFRFQTMIGSALKVYKVEFSGTEQGAPTNLMATPISQNQINLAWNDNSNNELNFRIDRKIGSGQFAPLATTGMNVETFNNTGLTANTTYSYRVKATLPGGESGFSNVVTAMTPPAGGGSGVVDGGIYELEPLNAPGMRLSVDGGGTTTGTNVEIWTDTNAPHQSWTAQAQTGGSFELISTHAAGQRLAVYQGGTVSGTNVQIANDVNATQQRWTAQLQTDGNYEITPTHATALRLNIAGGGTTNGTNVNVVTDNNLPAQRWKLLQQ